MRVWIAPLVLVLLTGCPPNGEEEGRSQHPEAQRYAVALVFDPSVFEAGDTAGFERLLADVDGLFSEIPQNSCVSLIIVEPASFTRGVNGNHCFEAQRKFGGDTIHPRALSNAVMQVRPQLFEAWKSAHSQATVDNANSCILTGIVRASRHIQKSEAMQRHIVVFSDMLEACTDWGDINLEVRVPSLPLDIGARKPDLSLVHSVTFVQVGNSRHLTNPRKAASVETFWMEMMNEWKLDTSGLRIEYGLPRQVFSRSTGGADE